MAQPIPQEANGPLEGSRAALEGLIVSVVRSMAHTDALASHGDDGVVLDVVVDGTRVVVSRPRRDASAIKLSPREAEIVRLVASGLPNKSIARVLDISQYTVSSHLRRVFTKLEVASRAEMVAVALRHRL